MVIWPVGTITTYKSKGLLYKPANLCLLIPHPLINLQSREMYSVTEVLHHFIIPDMLRSLYLLLFHQPLSPEPDDI